jgi:hypothetical protein
MQFQARIQITMCAHTLKTKKRAHIVSMHWVGMRSKYKNKEEMRQTVQGVWDQVNSKCSFQVCPIECNK